MNESFLKTQNGKKNPTKNANQNLNTKKTSKPIERSRISLVYQLRRYL